VISNEGSPTNRDDELDVVALWEIIWDSKYLILFICALCGLAAVLFAITATPKFRADVVIAEVHDSGLKGAASLTNQLGGLASLAGINLPSSGSDHDAQAVLQSRRLVEEFIKSQNLLSVLIPDTKKSQTLWFAVKQFRDSVVSIREDKRTNLTTVAIEWTNPKTAAQWANSFVALANELVRTRALDDSSRNIAYLNKQIAQTNVVDMQRVIYNLIESEMKTLMLANARAEYAFTVIDPAVPAEVRSSPKRTLISLSGFAIGLMIGVIAAFTRERLVRRLPNEPKIT
jgi:uncharacterized protein involved in exopolysaccharide biosynthesis